MTQTEFPARLPAGFREIWDALREADRESTSRQVLARDLGISTHTIQRILVDGDVPDLAGTRNARVLRAWVRIIARLARKFGRDARIWVEAVGISWDDTVAGVVDDTLAKLAAGDAGVRPDLGADEAGDEYIHRVAGYEFPDEAKVGIVSGGAGHSFLGAYVSGLIGAIRPDCRITVTTGGEADLTGRLTGSGPELDMVAGVADTLRRRMAGLDFVDIPGIKIRLSAICLRRREMEAMPPRWLEAVSPAISRDNKYMVLGDDLAARFLKGQCGVAEENLIMREPGDLCEAADTLVRESSLWESSMHQERWVILVGDEETCFAVGRTLEEREDFRRAYSVERLSKFPQDLPAFQVAIALPAWSQEIRDLLRAATGLELIGSGGAHTAHLYAGLLAGAFMKRNLVNLINPSISNGPHILTDFRAAGGVFRDVLCRELVTMLKIRIDEALFSRGLFKTREAVTAQAEYLAVQHARNLVPVEWAASLDRVGPGPMAPGNVNVLRVPANHCLSCSASLLDEGHRGASDRYCRICSDEAGGLRPRDEVQKILAEWFAHWHGRLDQGDAMGQANDFMDRMPAWCNN